MQRLASLRQLEELGLGQPALRSIPLQTRRRALTAASGWIAAFIRKRNAFPLVAAHDPEDLDVTGVTGHASVTWSAAGNATLVQDVAVKFTSAGSTPGALLTYTTNPHAGAYGGTFTGPGGTLDADGALVIDGQRFTIAGTVAVNDTFTFSTALSEPGVSLAVVQMAAWTLLHNRGVDAKTEADLQATYDAATAFARAVALGSEAQLDKASDATPGRAELGPLGSGQTTPWAFLGR